MGNNRTFHGCVVATDGDVASAPLSRTELLSVADILRPRASPYPLMRVGPNQDGAYLLPDDLAGIGACFSPGVNNFKNFEDELSDRYGIACHMCDRTSDLSAISTPLRPGLQTFEKMWLEPEESEESVSLEGWVTRLAPQPDVDLLLQMDIEGAEYRNILAVPDHILKRFRIIVLELHDLWSLEDPAIFRAVLKPFFEKLARHFVAVHAHPNNCCGEKWMSAIGRSMPAVLEVTFFRRDRIDGRPAGAALFQPMIPHPLDVARNVRKKPPMVLSEGWLEAGRPDASKIKILEDQVEWLSERERIAADEHLRDLETLASLTHGLHRRFAAHAAPPDAATERRIDGLADVAGGRPFVLGSPSGNRPKRNWRGVVHAGDPVFFETGPLLAPFVRVDLGAAHRVDALRLRNRRAGKQEQPKHLFVAVHDSASHDVAAAVPLDLSRAFFKPGSDWEVVRLDGMAGRFVTIFALHFTTLHLAGLQVLGEPIEAGSAATNRAPGVPA